MPRAKVAAVHILIDDINRTFNRIWPGFYVKIFGSVATGLALKGSDVDCLGELPANCRDDPAACVRKCQALIVTGTSPFHAATVVIKKVPIVKFVHTETGFHCDLSFDKPIVVDFGKLVGYLLSTDGRALKLAVLIKCWAKIHNVIGRRRMPSNVLIILIIFYLQQKEILPSIRTLQRNIPPNMVDGWNTAFAEIPYESRVRESIYHLLGGFFEYYREFHFRNLVVCPYLGDPLNKDEFRNDVHPDFHLFMENLNSGACDMMYLHCIMCVQDPFDHARNCAGPMLPQTVSEIIAQFKRAASVYATTDKTRVLNRLLTQGYVEPEQPAWRGGWAPPAHNQRTDRSEVQRRLPRTRRNNLSRKGRNGHVGVSRLRNFHDPVIFC